MADQMAGNRLEARLRSYRRQGISWEQIGRRLNEEAGIVVTAETLRRWAQQLGIGGKAA